MDYSPPGSTALWDFLFNKAGVGRHFLLQGIVPTLRLNLYLLHWQVNSLPLSQWTTPKLKSLLPNFHTFCGSLGEKNALFFHIDPVQKFVEFALTPWFFYRGIFTLDIHFTDSSHSMKIF